jgi:hypothetical protein
MKMEDIDARVSRSVEKVASTANRMMTSARTFGGLVAAEVEHLKVVALLCRAEPLHIRCNASPSP